MEKNEVIFRCRKCEHHLFVEGISFDLIDQISKLDCPACGEEPEDNWILVGLGNSEAQKENFKW